MHSHKTRALKRACLQISYRGSFRREKDGPRIGWYSFGRLLIVALNARPVLQTTRTAPEELMSWFSAEALAESGQQDQPHTQQRPSGGFRQVYADESVPGIRQQIS